MEKPKKYKVLISKDALFDITGYIIEGLSIYFRPYSTYLIFFVVEDSTVTVIRVLKDRMSWQSVISNMQKINK